MAIFLGHFGAPIVYFWIFWDILAHLAWSTTAATVFEMEGFFHTAKAVGSPLRRPTDPPTGGKGYIIDGLENRLRAYGARLDSTLHQTPGCVEVVWRLLVMSWLWVFQNGSNAKNEGTSSIGTIFMTNRPHCVICFSVCFVSPQFWNAQTCPTPVLNLTALVNRMAIPEVTTGKNPEGLQPMFAPHICHKFLQKVAGWRRPKKTTLTGKIMINHWIAFFSPKFSNKPS